MTPYFFLAYAHTPQRPWVARFYEHLCEEIVERTTWPTDVPAGFMDHNGIQTGEDWRNAVAAALATCRVFVPLYSPRYFTRPECGREWHAFSRRILDHRARYGDAPPAIVPVLWTPVTDAQIPNVARHVQVNFPAVNTHYAENGLFTLIKNSAYRRAYLRVVQQVAGEIIRSADGSALAPCHVSELHLGQDDFEDPPHVVPAHRRLTILVAAPTVGELPPGRASGCYGATPAEWNPFPGSSTRAIADMAGAIARSHGFEPRVLSLDRGLESMDWPDPAAGPGVALIDPWLALHDSGSTVLKSLDGMDAGWFSTAVVWDESDPQTQARGDDVRAAFRAKAPRRLADAGAPSSFGVAHSHTAEQFRRQLPSLLDGALNRFLTHAPAPDSAPPGGTGGTDGQ